MRPRAFFQDRVVLITGSSRGIGRETARQVLALGGRVVLHGRSLASVEATRAELGALDRTMAVAADLSRPEGASRLVSAVLQTWGSIDVLINNAGQSMRGAFSELGTATILTMIEANFLSAVWTTQAALPSLRTTRGRVYFVSSLAGVRGFPGVSLYSAAKMALTALQESLQAEERSQGVTSGVIYLGFSQNDPTKTVLAADGSSIVHDRPWSMTQTQVAAKILDAVARGKARTTLTLSGRCLFWLQKLAPVWLDRYLARSRGQIHSGY